MCSQPVCLGWSSVLNHRFTFVAQCVSWIGTKRKRAYWQIKCRCRASNEGLIGWKDSRNYCGNIKTSGCISKPVGDYDCRSGKTVLGRKHICSVNRLRTYEKRVATGAIVSKAVPTARGKDTHAL